MRNLARLSFCNSVYSTVLSTNCSSIAMPAAFEIHRTYIWSTQCLGFLGGDNELAQRIEALDIYSMSVSNFVML